MTKGERTAPYLVAERVEVLHNGQWGTICSKGFDWIDAQVLCQKLTGPLSSVLRYGEVGSYGLEYVDRVSKGRLYILYCPGQAPTPR